METVWSNLNPVDVDKRRPYEIEDQLAQLRLLSAQVTILRPDAVVFLTGPAYDGILNINFPGAVQATVSALDIRTLCKVSHQDLPRKTFRTYHPKYLRLSKQYGSVLQCLRTLVQEPD
jgi:hypothetical protein